MLFFLPPLVLSHSRGVCSFQFPSVFWVEFGIHVCLRMSVTNLSQTLWQCFCFFPCLSCDPVFSFPFFCSFPQGLAHLKLQSRGMGPVFLFSFVLFFSFLFFPISLLPKSPLHNPIIPTISYTIRCCSSVWFPPFPASCVHPHVCVTPVLCNGQHPDPQPWSLQPRPKVKLLWSYCLHWFWSACFSAVQGR